MLRMLAVILLMFGIVAPAAGQETDSEPADTEQTQTDDEQSDDADLDDESYADAEDDDFRPSEDIPADQSIPFPTDI